MSEPDHKTTANRLLIRAPYLVLTVSVLVAALSTIFPVNSYALRLGCGLAFAAAMLGGTFVIVHRRRAAWRLILFLLLGPLILFVCLTDDWRVVNPDSLLANNSKQVELAWRELLDELSSRSEVSFDPPRGEPRVEDQARFGWSQRDPVSGAVLEWRGWTTDIDATEWSALAPTQPSTARALVVQRGLETRLLLAVASPKGFLVTERQLAAGLAAGPLSNDLSPAIVARARWFRLGEGIAPPTTEEEQVPTTQRLLVNLRDPSGTSIGRVALLYAPSGQATAWRAYLVLTVVLGIWSLATAPWFSPRWTISSGVLLVILFWRNVAVLSPNPLAADGLVFWLPLGVAIALRTTARPAMLRAHRSRLATLLGLVTGIALSIGLTLLVPAVELGGPGELTLDAFSFGGRRWLAVLMIQAPLLLGVLRAASVFQWKRRAMLSGLAMLTALLAITHMVAGERALRAHVESTWARELVQREEIWQTAMSDLLESTERTEITEQAPPSAIDAWWRSALARRGLICGVWRTSIQFGVEQVDDELLTGVPQLAKPPQGGLGTPRPFRAEVLGVPYDLSVMERPRKTGGRWVVAVLDSPSNIPSRQRRDPLRGLHAERLPPLSPLNDPDRQPQLVAFDSSGSVVASDVAAPPPAPLDAPDTPRWRVVPFAGGSAALLDTADRDGVVSVILPLPTWLARVALVLGWVLLALFAALAIRLLTSAWVDPAATWSQSVASWRALRINLRAQLGLALALAGLIPLVGLAIATRTVTRAQAEQRLIAEAAQRVDFGATLLQDLLALRTEDSAAGEDRTDNIPIDRETASWLARTLGEDLFIWRDGRLLATNRDDLVRAGRWPARMDGELWRRFAEGGQALWIERRLPSAAAFELPSTIAHGIYREPRGRAGVLSLPLGQGGRRPSESLVDVDRALLVSTALLLGLAALAVIPATRRLTAPLTELRTATQRLAEGDFATTVPETGFEETRALARAFREMAASLGRQQRALRARAAAIEALITSIPVAVIATRDDGTVAATNPRAVAILDVGPDRTFAPADGILGDAVRRAVQQRGPTSEIASPVDTSGPRHFRVTGLDLPQSDESGDATRLVILEDLTDTVRSERLVAWAEMARRVAHEIKNPLTPISLMVDHVRRLASRNDPDFPQVLIRCLDTIAEQVRVLRDTSREFSDYARLLIARPERVDISEAIEGWLKPYRLAPPGELRFEWHAPAGPALVVVDPRLLRRAVINLVENAVAAAGDRGQVCVRLHARGDEWVVDVEDDGPGIDPRKLEQLFEPDVTTRETGSGLGLPIVREAVEALGGRLDVNSEPGKGTRFSVSLPGG